jgi:hypothetical protein
MVDAVASETDTGWTLPPEASSLREERITAALAEPEPFVTEPPIVVSAARDEPELPSSVEALKVRDEAEPIVTEPPVEVSAALVEAEPFVTEPPFEERAAREPFATEPPFEERAARNEPDVEPPPPGLRLHSRPPPKPNQTPSEPAPTVALPVATVPEIAPPVLVASVVTTTAPVARSAPHQEPPGARSSRFSPLVMGASVAASVLAFAFGLSLGKPSPAALEQARVQAQAAVDAAKAQGLLEGKAMVPKLSPVFDLTAPTGSKPLAEVLQAEASMRSRLDAIALGRHWSKARYDAVMTFVEELKRAPQKLDDKKVRVEVLNYVADRMVSRVVLETLAEVGTVRSLDLLYEIWIGSKERNETTQLAEALLLAKDVRKNASSALELSLALREKPTACDAIARYVELAIKEGDRRSVMPLVTTSQRVNCGPSGDEECIQCLTEPKDMRKAIRLAAARGEPLP